MPSSFTREIAASLPPQLTLPKPFEIVCDWMEASGHVEPYVDDARRGLFAAPSESERGFCYIHPHPDGWPEEIASRLAFIMQTGGDGSQAAIWLDDEGRQRFVHVGSGSGSTMLCVLTEDPLDMLRLFAIGHEDICWPEDYGLTAEQVRENATFVTNVEAYAGFLEREFNVTIPARADEIITATADAYGPESDDLFWRWAMAHGLNWV